MNFPTLCKPTESKVKYSSYFTDSNEKYPVIKVKYSDPLTDKTIEEFEISHSTHSYLRARSRGLSIQDIWLAIDYGKMWQKQGLVFYTVLEKNIPSSLDGRTKERIKNIVVVTNGNGSQILTCYKSKSASRQIQKKSQRSY